MQEITHFQFSSKFSQSSSFSWAYTALGSHRTEKVSAPCEEGTGPPGSLQAPKESGSWNHPGLRSSERIGSPACVQPPSVCRGHPPWGPWKLLGCPGCRDWLSATLLLLSLVLSRLGQFLSSLLLLSPPTCSCQYCYAMHQPKTECIRQPCILVTVTASMGQKFGQFAGAPPCLGTRLGSRRLG